MAKIPRYQLAQVVSELSLSDRSPKALAKSVAAYLLEERRSSELDSLLRDVQKLRAQAGHVEVLAKMAREPLNQDLLKQMGRPFKALYPGAKSVTVTPVGDAHVIGGASLELAEQRLDLSIARRLRRFKQAINQRGRS